MSNKYYCYSFDNEYFHLGGATIEECLEEARKDNPDSCDYVHIGEHKDLVYRYDLDELIEDLETDVHWEHGFSEFEITLSDEKKKKAKKKLKELIEFITEDVTTFTVENIKRIPLWEVNHEA